MRKIFVWICVLCWMPAIVLAAQQRSAPRELHLAAGTFRPGVSTGAPDWFRGSEIERSVRGQRYLVAIVDAALGTEQRRQLEAAGAELLDYVPVNGYRLRVDPRSIEAVRSLPFVAWLGPLPSHLKVGPRLSSRAGRPDGFETVRVVLSEDEPPDRVIGLLAGLAADAVPSGRRGAWRVQVTLPGARLSNLLSRLVSLPEVEAVEPVRPVHLFNQDAVWVHQSFVGPSPQETPLFDRGIFGCDQIVAVADTGQDYDLCFFSDPVKGSPPISACAAVPCPAGTPDTAQRKNIIYYNWSGTPTGDDDTCPATIGPSGHGTHTSGSVAGDSSPYADCSTFATPGRNGGDGQAPGAKLVIQELGDGLEYLNERAGTMWNLVEVAYQNGARIHSNSWGGACHDIFGTCLAGCTMPYDSMARDADLAMWTYPDMLIVTSAGNAGDFCAPPISIGTPAVAKSPLVVGSLGHGNSAIVPSSFSSPGPVFDGRLKPTLAAQGEFTVSAASDANPNSSNCGSCSLDGTSMAAPTVSGLAALVREYYTRGFYVSGHRDPAQGINPSAALVKATMVDGSVAQGSASPDPDFKSGFGRALLGSTLAFDDSSFQLRVVDHAEGLVTGGVVTRAYDVGEGTPFRATLAWSDYPGALNAAVARVNELMLEVIDPTGTVWFRTIDLGSGLPAQTSDPVALHDSLNVVERLVFETPVAGRWIVRVRGVNVAWGPQPFALVVRGALGECGAPAGPGALTIDTPADGQAELSWDPVVGAVGYNVYRSFGSCPAGASVPVATGLAGTSFLDTGVSGGATYSYKVVATSDSDSACESAPSPCASVVPTGDCLLTPQFRGVTAAASDGLVDCSITLSWDAASAYCGGPVRYNVYRDSAADFVPSAANRVASCISATSFSDTVDLVHGTDYHYVVRAEDGTVGHGGPCGGGNEDGNLAYSRTAPYGPPEAGTWSDDAGDTGEVKLQVVQPWTLQSAGGDSGPSAYVGSSAGGLCADLVSPVLTLANPASGPQLSFSTKHDIDYDPFGIFGAEGSVGQVEIAIGPDFASWTRVPLGPDYPTYVDFPLNQCPTTANIDSYFSGSDLVYKTYSASLVNWAGGDVKLRFRFAGDLIYTNGTWWIDDVSITQAQVPGACSTRAAGPPPIPDGASVAGEPLRVAKSGGDVALSWDAGQCPAAEVNVYRGVIGDYSTFVAGDCGLAPTGSATLAVPEDSWFLVASTDGGSTDGSWSRDANGSELSYAGASSICPTITQHVPNGTCP
jgi:hypothetical protein